MISNFRYTITLSLSLFIPSLPLLSGFIIAFHLPEIDGFARSFFWPYATRRHAKREKRARKCEVIAKAAHLFARKVVP